MNRVLSGKRNRLLGRRLLEQDQGKLVDGHEGYRTTPNGTERSVQENPLVQFNLL